MKKFINSPRSSFGPKSPECTETPVFKSEVPSRQVQSKVIAVRNQANARHQNRHQNRVLNRLEGKLLAQQASRGKMAQDSCSVQIFPQRSKCHCAVPRCFRELHHSPLWSGFALLPNSRKVTLARKSTFTLSLQMALEDALRSSSSTGSTQLDEIVTMSNLASPDYQGWLTDELSGQKHWCVLADMLFCVFETEHSERPLKVLLLPGMHVAMVTYQSAKQDVITDQNRELLTSSRTVSGMYVHQFVIFDEVTSQRYVYGAETQSVIDGWIVYLKAATNLDTDVFLDDNDVSSGSLSERTYLSSPESAGGSRRTSLMKSVDSDRKLRYLPSSKSALPRKVALSSTDDIPQNGPVTNGENNVKFSIGSPDLTGDGGSVTTTTSGESNQSDSAVKLKKKLSKHSRTQSMDAEKIDQNNITLSREQSEVPRLVRSNSAAASFARSSLGAKIARTASNIREKMFGSKSRDDTLGSLTNIKISGHLHNKQLLKWIRLWCVICDGMIYGYRSDDPSAKPELALPLSECNLVTVETDKNKRMYIFKLSHLNAKHVLLSAGNIYEFDRWFEVFRKEAVFKSTPSSASSTPRNDPNTSLQIDILGNIISKSTSPIAHKSLNIPDTSSPTRAQRNRNQFKLKLNRSIDSSISISSQGSESDISDFHSSSVNTSPQKQTSPPSLNSHRHTSSPLLLDPSLSSFEANYLNSAKDQKRDTFWTEAYVKNYSLPQNRKTAELRRNQIAAESESDVPESDEESFVNSTSEHLTESKPSQSRMVPKFGGFPRHDENLKQVWKNDKNYQLHVLKSKVAALPNRPLIFNKHLPGPNNEGLLLVGDEDEGKSNKGNEDQGSSGGKQKVRPEDRPLLKSASDTSLSVKMVLQNLPLPDPHTPSRHVQPAQPRENLNLPIAARDIENPAICGYLEQFVTENEWNSIWCVLKQSVVYTYTAPIDDVTHDVIGLKGYRVTVLKPVADKKFTFQLKGENGDVHIFSAENKEDLHVWVPSIHRAISVARSDATASLPVTVFTDNKPDLPAANNEESLQEKLLQLEELQRQCNELRQSASQPRPNSPATDADTQAAVSCAASVTSESGSTKVTNQSLEEQPEETSVDEMEKSIKDMTHLRKRRLSTQLKVDTLQKELDQHVAQKHDKGKKRFSISLFEKTKVTKPVNQTPEPPPTPGQLHLQNQIKELTNQMSDIDRNMSIEQIKQHLHNMTSGKNYLGSLQIESQETSTNKNTSKTSKIKSSQHNPSPSNSDFKSISDSLTKFMTQPFQKRRDIQSLPYDVHEDDSYPGDLYSAAPSDGQKDKPSKSSKRNRLSHHGRSTSIDIGDLESRKRTEHSNSPTLYSSDYKQKKEGLMDQNRNSIKTPDCVDVDNWVDLSVKQNTISPTVMAEIAAFEELIQEHTTCMV